MTSLIVNPSRGSHGQVLALARRYPHERFYQLSNYYPDDHVRLASSIKNLTLLQDSREALMKYPSFDRLITLGASDHSAHALSFQLSMVFRKLGKPRIDVQHGLILSGYNEFIDGEKAVTTIFADKLVPMSAFGPLQPFRKTFEVKQSGPRNHRIGVSSNLHWDVYDGKERANFLRSVKALATSFPEYEVLWRPHPAEYQFHGDERTGNFLPLNTLGIVNENLRVMTYEETEAQGPEEFIDDIDALFTSVSTMMLDAEQGGTPCVTQHSRRLARSLDGFERFALSRSPEQAVALMRRALDGDQTIRFESGFPRQFDTVGFAAALGLSTARPGASASRRKNEEDEILAAFEIYSALAKFQ